LSRSAQLLPFIALLDRIGAPTDRGIERNRLPPNLREDPSLLLSTHAQAAFVGDMSLREGIDEFDWLACSRDLELIPLTACGIGSAPTLLRALVIAVEQGRLDASGTRVWLEAQDDTILFHHRSAVEPGASGASHLAVMRTAILISLVRVFAGSNWLPPECQLPVEEEVGCLVGVERGAIRIRRAAGDGWIRIPRSLLAAPPRVYLSPTRNAGATDADRPALDLVGSLQQALRPYLCQGGPPIHEAAALAGMSVRSLQRELAHEGTSYRELLQRVKFSVARELLAQPDAKINEIAHRTGYEDQAHFTRLFQRLAGMSPSEYRTSLSE
jgi:AraC-like DNA-binding protein